MIRPDYAKPRRFVWTEGHTEWAACVIGSIAVIGYLALVVAKAMGVV